MQNETGNWIKDKQTSQMQYIVSQMVFEGSEVWSHCLEEEVRGSSSWSLRIGGGIAIFLCSTRVLGRMSLLLRWHGISQISPIVSSTLILHGCLLPMAAEGYPGDRPRASILRLWFPHSQGVSQHCGHLVVWDLWHFWRKPMTVGICEILPWGSQ